MATLGTWGPVSLDAAASQLPVQFFFLPGKGLRTFLFLYSLRGVLISQVHTYNFL